VDIELPTLPSRAASNGLASTSETAPASSLRDGFATRLKSLRIAYGEAYSPPRLTTAEFAALLGVEPGRYRRYERAETEPPFWLLVAIQRMTGVSLDWLVSGTGPSPVMAPPETESRPAPTLSEAVTITQSSRPRLHQL
jgi:transcriptional regulator with XRE-family HTH domain